MKSAIENIYDGNAGEVNTPISEEYRKLLKEINDKNDEIMKTLSTKQKALFEEISEISNGLEAEARLSSFKHGFELGLSIGMEIALK